MPKRPKWPELVGEVLIVEAAAVVVDGEGDALGVKARRRSMRLAAACLRALVTASRAMRRRWFCVAAGGGAVRR